jgi:hypothetical protein
MPKSFSVPLDMLPAFAHRRQLKDFSIHHGYLQSAHRVS